jgi:hypothetical protein
MFSRNMMMIGMGISLCPCKSALLGGKNLKLILYSEDFLTEIIKQR